METLDKMMVALISLTLVAVLVSSKSATSNALTTAFSGMTLAVSTLMAPLKAT